VVRDRRGVLLLAGIALVALTTRFLPYVLPGVLVTQREYDDGVMFAAALSMLSGQWPYQDFVYLHPPGSFLWLAPSALLAGVVDEATAFAVARVLAVATGVANTVLIGVLLRRFGTAAMVTGALLYAVWPVAVATEQVYLLEPVLNLLLLVALWSLSRRALAMTWIAGIALGVALTVKYWAVVDIAVVAVIVAVRFGARGLVRFVAGAAGAAAVVALPFFVRAPAEMWQQSVMTQLSRPPAGTSLAARANRFSLFVDVPWLDALVPWLVWAALLVALLVIALLPLARALRARTPASVWPDAVWWGLLAVIHAVLIAASGVFYNHYATWVLAPLALSTGAAVAALSHRRVRRGLVAGIAAVALVAGLAGLTAVRPTSLRIDEVTAWSSTRECVWGDPTKLIQADTVQRNIARGCAFDVDPFGVGLVLVGPDAAGDAVQDEPVVHQHTWRQLERADGVVLGTEPAPRAGGSPGRFAEEFAPAGSSDGVGMWSRRGT
jgi:alpha-1,2-mannosyltransferase